MTAPNIRVIHAPRPVASMPNTGLLGSDRVMINPVAGQRFDELQRIVAKAARTFSSPSATAAGIEQAIAALLEAEALAKAARVALGAKS